MSSRGPFLFCAAACRIRALRPRFAQALAHPPFNRKPKPCRLHTKTASGHPETGPKAQANSSTWRKRCADARKPLDFLRRTGLMLRCGTAIGVAAPLPSLGVSSLDLGRSLTRTASFFQGSVSGPYAGSFIRTAPFGARRRAVAAISYSCHSKNARQLCRSLHAARCRHATGTNPYSAAARGGISRVPTAAKTSPITASRSAFSRGKPALRA